MPLTTVRITRVYSSVTSKPDVTSYLIEGDADGDGIPEFQVHTVNAFAASLCERAMTLQRPIGVLWKDGRFGKQLVNLDWHEDAA